MRRVVLLVALTLAACDTPLRVKTIARIVEGTSGRVLVAEDGSLCRASASSFIGVPAIYQAKVGDAFECGWVWQPETATKMPAEAP